MSTSKQRINVSVSDELNKAIIQLAKRDNMPTATKATRLIEIGLENEEDEVWDRIAKSRDTAKAKFISHEQVFKK